MCFFEGSTRLLSSSNYNRWSFFFLHDISPAADPPPHPRVLEVGRALAGLIAILIDHVMPDTTMPGTDGRPEHVKFPAIRRRRYDTMRIQRVQVDRPKHAACGPILTNPSGHCTARGLIVLSTGARTARGRAGVCPPHRELPGQRRVIIEAGPGGAAGNFRYERFMEITPTEVNDRSTAKQAARCRAVPSCLKNSSVTVEWDGAHGNTGPVRDSPTAVKKMAYASMRPWPDTPEHRWMDRYLPRRPAGPRDEAVNYMGKDDEALAIHMTRLACLPRAGSVVAVQSDRARSATRLPEPCRSLLSNSSPPALHGAGRVFKQKINSVSGGPGWHGGNGGWEQTHKHPIMVSPRSNALQPTIRPSGAKLTADAQFKREKIGAPPSAARENIDTPRQSHFLLLHRAPIGLLFPERLRIVFRAQVGFLQCW
nr:unnamed protein product [Digitaria exilis]